MQSHILLLERQPAWTLHQYHSILSLYVLDVLSATTTDYLATNIFTIVTDLVILALPIPILTKVSKPRLQKLGLIAVFGTGALSTIASCVRLYTIRVYTTSSDPIYDAAPINLWSFIEINLGLICASAPALKGLFAQPRHGSGTYTISRGSSATVVDASRSRSLPHAYELDRLAVRVDSHQDWRDVSKFSIRRTDDHTPMGVMDHRMLP